MTIPEIKAALPITTVLAHYGLEAGPTGSMRCPFHDDQAASMKITLPQPHQCQANQPKNPPPR